MEGPNAAILAVSVPVIAGRRLPFWRVGHYNNFVKKQYVMGAAIRHADVRIRNAQAISLIMFVVVGVAIVRKCTQARRGVIHRSVGTLPDDNKKEQTLTQ